MSIALNWIDYSFIVIIIFSVLISLIRGFIKEALSLVSWGLAIWVGMIAAPRLSGLFSHYVSNAQIRLGIAFFIVFLIVLILGGVLNFFVSHLVKKTGLSGTDRVLGLAFGGARGVLAIAILMLVASLTTFPQSAVWHTSPSINFFKPVALWIQDWLPTALNVDLLKAESGAATKRTVKNNAGSSAIEIQSDRGASVPVRINTR